MKLRIFVSYCHEDIKPDDGRLTLFLNSLSECGPGLYEILADSVHNAASIGANLQIYMKQVDSVDAVIILLTPGYKQRVSLKGNTGVYTEFRRIYDRLLKSEEDDTYGRTFLVLPIIFTSNYNDVCPPEIRHLLCKDLAWMYVIPDGKKPSVRKTQKARLQQLVTEVADRIAAISATKSQIYLEHQQNLFQDFLFADTKSRWYRPENKRYLNAFVKTSTFLRVRNREVSFIVGRKGAGKSTITDVLPYMSSVDPAKVLAIDFEQLPFETCFNVLRDHPAEASDLRHAFSPIYCYQLLWDLFLHLFLAWAVRDHIPHRVQPQILINRLLANPIARATDPLERNAIATKVLFTYAFEKIMEYINIVIRRPRSAKGIAGAVGDFSPSGLREYVLGTRGWRTLQDCLALDKSVNNRVLVTADGFDTMVGYFTQESENPRETTRFERELLLGLCQLVLHKEPAKIGRSLLYDRADFCIAIPYDRFRDIRQIDRDRYRFRQRFARIEWSGIELSSLVRKRLALLRSISDRKGLSLEGRLAHIMQKGYPELPDEVTFLFGSARYKLPLFIYVLRHTFWRPRDVLFIYASLLTAADAFRKQRKSMPTEFVRQVVAGATSTIVKDEFLAEFSSSFSNLPDVLSLFRHGPQVLSWGELRARIDKIQFDALAPGNSPPSIEAKVEILFDLGAIGVVLERKESEKLLSFRHAFSFNEPNFLPDKLGRADYPRVLYALHPVFREFLHLDTSNNPELILPMTWEYLHSNEVLRGIAPA